MAEPKTTEKLDTIALTALRDGALSFAKIADEALKIMKSHELACYNVKSGLAGIDRLKAFEDALSQAILLHRTGRPFETGQLKSRSTAKKKSPSAKEKKTSPTLRIAERPKQKYKNDDSK